MKHWPTPSCQTGCHSLKECDHNVHAMRTSNLMVLLCVGWMFMVICSVNVEVLTAVRMNIMVLRDVTADGVGTDVAERS